MVDDSELDYVRTFLGKVHTAATSKSFSETKNISLISDTERMLTYPPEIIAVYQTRIKKRYKVSISENSEANMTTALNNIQIGILKANRREAIAAWTRPSTWCYVEIANSNPAFENPQTKRWDCNISLDIEWSIE